MTGRPPLVYSCSGCSSAAQMANHLALQLDRAGVAEMSCIAGVGGGVTGLVRTAQSGRRILALDGCILKCASACLTNAGVVADTHLVLSDYGVKKRQHADFDATEARRVYLDKVLPAARALLALPAAATGETVDVSTSS
ncbi:MULTISPECIES: putative zinc-binding protein [unclassified Rhodanobacter]|uniref:putative zinc-binding protein n=1 Tax=unclassified Rhodanobacter TaxID=2621553 RepID=UPI00098581C7|nr:MULTISPECIES: putative zinc-binding protein [unclassified Rhodanobacter]OOG38553.1 zinc-binding protein [Rhodanobacter sp. C05]OOG50108.1 zinc-binding protein [Rhodanobacter sp. C01]OOG52294.1 zinc-binding protein [Rhodanobacter sp. C03]OOG65975.1 zinc-binding protein [Rhodanobacter sp. B04]